MKKLHYAHFTYAGRSARKKQLLANTLVFEIYTKIFDEYNDEIPVDKRFAADRRSRVLTMTDYDANSIERPITLEIKHLL